MSNNNDLVERYLYAITRRLPANQRADVAKELRVLISDMLEERCRGLAATEKDVRVVLTELGMPDEVVRKYREGTEKCLIGEPYYFQFILVLKVVLACVSGGILIAAAIALLGGSSDTYLARGLGWIGTWIGAITFSFSFVTVMFAIFSRKGIEVNISRSLDDLPSVPRQTQSSTRADAVVGIVFSIIGAMVFLLFPEVLNARSLNGDGVSIELFNIEVIRASAWIIITWTLVCITGECFKLVEGRYSLRLFAVTCVVDVAAAVLVIIWLTNYQIIDTDILLQMANSMGGSLSFEGPALWSLQNAQVIFCLVVVGALLIDMIDEAVKTFRTHRGSQAVDAAAA